VDETRLFGLGRWLLERQRKFWLDSMRAKVSTQGLRDALAVVMAVFFAVGAMLLGSIVYAIVAVGLLVMVVPWPGSWERVAAQDDATRVAAESPVELRERKQMVFGVLALVGLTLAVGGAVGGRLLLGPWGGTVGLVIALVPWFILVARLSRAERDRVTELVVARAPSMTPDELEALLTGLGHRFDDKLVRALRARLGIPDDPPGPPE